VSHRPFRSTLVPIAPGLAAAIAVSWLVGVVGSVPALAASGYGGPGSRVQGQEWWLGGLHVTQAWRTTEGAGITVAVLGQLARQGEIKPEVVGQAITKYRLDLPVSEAL